MKVNVKEFLQEAGIEEPFYPGKRLVHRCKQMGEFKSHCVVFDWRDPDKIRIEVKPGLSGRDLAPERLKYYPVSFQTPTYVDIEVVNDNEEEKGEDDKGKSSSSSSSGGGKSPKKNLDDMKSVAFEAFGEAIDKVAPELGKIVDMAVMGVKIAEEAYGQVMGALAQQIEHAKIATTELLAQAGKFVTKYTPPSFMQPTGNEDAQYSYDREKNADIGFRQTLG